MTRRHYAWVVAAVTFVTLLGAAGFRSAPGVLIVPLHDELGWSREWVSAAVAVNLVLFGLIGPFAAALMGRYGLRRVVLAALLTVSGAALAKRHSSSTAATASGESMVGDPSGAKIWPPNPTTSS